MQITIKTSPFSPTTPRFTTVLYHRNFFTPGLMVFNRWFSSFWVFGAQNYFTA